MIAGATLDRVVATLSAMPPRFAVSTTPLPGAVSLLELGDPERMRSVLADYAAVRSTEDRQIAASLFVQGLAMRVTGVALAAAVLDGVLLRPTAEQVSFRPTGLTFEVAMLGDATTGVDGLDAGDVMARWHEHWTDGLMDGLVDDVRAACKVGRRMLEGNVASAIAANLVFLDWWEPSRGAGEWAEPLLRGGRRGLGHLVSFAGIEHRGRTGLRSTRSTCCMAKDLPDPHVCPTCPKLTAEGQEAATRVHLGHLDAVKSGAVPPGPPGGRRPTG